MASIISSDTWPTGQTLQELVEKATAGHYCIVCAALFPGDQYDIICYSHHGDIQSLTSIALRELQRFLNSKTAELIADDIALPQLPSLSGAQRDRMIRLLLPFMECRNHLVDYEAIARIIQSYPNSIVDKIEEVSYRKKNPVDVIFWHHAAFRVTLKSGAVMALDITSPQFGPDRPLLQDWNAYVRDHVDQTPLKSSTVPPGLNAQAQEFYPADILRGRSSTEFLPAWDYFVPRGCNGATVYWVSGSASTTTFIPHGHGGLWDVKTRRWRP